jgi:hypothetical protein
MKRIRIQLITLIRIQMRIRIFICCGSLILFDADAEPGSQNNADPDPDLEHCTVVCIKQFYWFFVPETAKG